MAQIVIDIPNWLYNAIMECKEPTYSQSLGDAVRDGTPLPKGHGRIADVDKMLDEMRATRTYDILFALERVKPIIEADKINKK